MKKTWIALFCAVLLAVLPVLSLAEANFASVTYDMFEIQKLTLDENKKVTDVIGVYERVYEDEDGIPAPAYDKETFTYKLAADCKFVMWDRDSEDTIATVEVDDLYAWYVKAYLNGEEPANGLTFLADVPEAEKLDAQVDFWFITAKIELNEQGEITLLQEAYVPWN